MRLDLALLITAIAIAGLAGCSTREQRQREVAQRAQAQIAAAESMRSGLENRCRGYGFQPGTTAFAQCLMQMDQLASQAAAAQQARKQQEGRCADIQAQACLTPGRRDCFTAYQTCMAGLPPAPQLQNIICRREPGLPNQVYCFTQ
jgi:membrane protease subunit (stomatin/prohibitin family)